MNKREFFLNACTRLIGVEKECNIMTVAKETAERVFEFADKEYPEIPRYNVYCQHCSAPETVQSWIEKECAMCGKDFYKTDVTESYSCTYPKCPICKKNDNIKFIKDVHLQDAITKKEYHCSGCKNDFSIREGM